MNNTFGTLFTLTTFGESHGEAIGGVIDGCPAGLKIDFDAILKQLELRCPGKNYLTSTRKEDDIPVFISGILNGVTTGAPIAFTIKNKDAKPEHYNMLGNVFRPGHADYTYYKKYNGHNDTRGGGRSSARETACRVVAGQIALQLINRLYPDLSVRAYTKSIADITTQKSYAELDLSLTAKSSVGCPESETSQKMEIAVNEARKEGDTLGAVIECVVHGCPVGIGEPIYDKLSARLASAMMSINAAKGFEIGDGFQISGQKGSQAIDAWRENITPGLNLKTVSNKSGGIQGGISNGEDIVFKVAFKPVPTLFRPFESYDRQGNHVRVTPLGRHDPCVTPRVIPVVEAMTALVLADFILIDRARKI